MNFRFVVAAALAVSLSACGGGGDEPAPAPAPVQAPVQVPVQVPVLPANDVAVAASGPATPVVGGGRASYTFTATNAGPQAASNVALTLTVGAQQTLGTVQCAATGGAVCPTALSAAMTAPAMPKDGRLTFTVGTSVSAGADGALGVMLAAKAADDTLASNDTATASATATPPNSVMLRSDSGDYIGQGRTHAYSRTNASLQVTANGNEVSVSVAGDENWHGSFALPGSGTNVQAGTYAGATRAAFRPAGTAGIDWSGEGRGCNTVSGSFTVSKVTYAAGVLQSIDLAFEQHCEGNVPALHGQVHWTAYDDTAPAGPVSPVPAGLWQPAAGVTPATGNYVYLVSDSGDYIGGGATILETQATTTFTVTGNGRNVAVNAGGWNANFSGMDILPLLQPGYYGGLKRHPFHSGIKGGMDWSGNGRGCNTLSGWFVVDSVSYSGTQLSAIDLRFEQHCEGGAAALRGKVHWAAGDTTAPPGPVNPPPASLWQPAAGTVPASGNFIHLVSDAGDYIGEGATRTYTPGNATVLVTPAGQKLSFDVDGWTSTFVTMNTLSRFEPGYYGALSRYPFHNVVKGGLNWSGNGRGCNTLSGWFAVDSVVYDGSTLKAIDMRFEQHCEGRTAALRGRIRWTL